MRPKARKLRARPVPLRASRSGIVLIYALFVVILVLILGLAFMQTSTAMSLANVRSIQRLQATAAAEYGIARARAMAESTGNQHGVWFTMTYNGGSLSWNTSAAYSGHDICTLFSNQTVPANTEESYTVVIEDLTGDVETSGTYRIHSYGKVSGYTRQVSLDSQALTYASFGWLTNNENGVWFVTGDSLSGLIWTNGQFNIDGNPAFKGPVYTDSSSVKYMNGGPPKDNPTFSDGISYNAPYLNIGSLMSGGNITAIQKAANSGGVSEPSNSGNGYVLTFNAGGTYTIQKYTVNRSGQQTLTTVVANAAVSGVNGAFYFQDTVQVSGTITGQVTIATSSGNDIDITGNLVYSYPANPASLFNGTTSPTDPLLVSKCALVSGGNVVVDQSWSGTWTNMYITASIASVTGSFENQYYTSTPQRTLNIYGGIAQITRGAVGTTSGTGFLKDYIFDTRFTTKPPPYLPVIGAQFSNWQLY